MQERTRRMHTESIVRQRDRTIQDLQLRIWATASDHHRHMPGHSGPIEKCPHHECVGARYVQSADYTPPLRQRG